MDRLENPGPRELAAGERGGVFGQCRQNQGPQAGQGEAS